MQELCCRKLSDDAAKEAWREARVESALERLRMLLAFAVEHPSRLWLAAWELVGTILRSMVGTKSHSWLSARYGGVADRDVIALLEHHAPHGVGRLITEVSECSEIAHARVLRVVCPLARNAHRFRM